MSKILTWPGWDTVRELGSGSFGTVYEIRKQNDSGPDEYRAALKVISIPNSEKDYSAYKDDGYDDADISSIFQSQLEDIVQEVSLMSRFKGTANIVSYEDHMIVPHEDGRGWDILIRMELLTPFPEYYERNNGMNEADIIRLGTDLCGALERCARKKVIHRDIKPQNIFINEFGDFKLGDFGIARVMEHTTRATKAGTGSYMAPEVYTGRPYNETADIYSLGLLLYWLLNERKGPFLPLPPAVPTVSQYEDAVKRRMDGEAIPAPKNGSAALKAVVLKACAYDPALRYQNAAELKAALKNSGNAANTVDLTERVKNPAAGYSRPAPQPAVRAYPKKQCPACGNPISPGARFCQICGSSQFAAPAAQVPPKKKKKGLMIGIAAAVLLVMAGIGALAEKAFQKQNSGSKHTNDRSSYSDTYGSYPEDDGGDYSDYDWPDYTKGTFDGSVYTNEWADMTLVCPEGYSNASAELYALSENETTDCGVYLFADDSSGFMYICFEDVADFPDLDEGTYLEILEEIFLETPDVTYVPAEGHPLAIIGEYYYLKATGDMYNDNGCFAYTVYTRRQDDYMVSIFAMGISQEETEALASEIKPYY